DGFVRQSKFSRTAGARATNGARRLCEPGRPVRAVARRTQTRARPQSKFDLTLYAGAGDKQIKLALVYRSDLFAPVRMTEMLAQFEHLLSQVVSRADEPISRLSWVTSSGQEVLPNPTAPLKSSET